MKFQPQVKEVLFQRQAIINQSNANHHQEDRAPGTEFISTGKSEKLTSRLQPCNILENWVLEYSQSQGAFHVQKLHYSLRDNMLATISGRRSDYLILGIFPNEEQCHELSIKLLPKLNNLQPRQLSNLTIDDILTGNHFD